MKRNSKQYKIGKRVISIAMTLILLLSVFYVSEMDGWISDALNLTSKIVHAKVPTTKPVEIESLYELYRFSNNYANVDGQHGDFARNNQNAELKIVTSEPIVLELSHEFTYKNEEDVTVTEYLDYIPIGTSDYVFAGKMTISIAPGSYYSIDSQMPLFDFVYDSVDIKNVGGSVQQLALNRTGSFQDKALFATNVIHDTRSGSSASEWSIYGGVAENEDEESTSAFNYSSLITSIGDNATVNLTFENHGLGSDGSRSNINASTSNAGLFAGTLGEGATLNAHLVNGTVNNWSVSTSGGHAGSYSDQALETLVEGIDDFNELNHVTPLPLQ